MNTADSACNKLKNRSGNPFKAVTRRFSQSAGDLYVQVSTIKMK